MILIENIAWLKQRYAQLYKELTKNEPTLNNGNIQVHSARNGEPTLTVDINGKPHFLLSKYDPSNEGRQMSVKFRDLDGAKHILFYGIGLGYHINEIMREHPTLNFSVYEPNPAIFYKLLCTKNLSDLPLKRLKRLYIGNSSADMHATASDFVNKVLDPVYLLIHPAYERLFQQEYEYFMGIFRSYVTGHRSSIRTNLGYEKLWTVNSANNLRKVLQTPSLLRQKKSLFEEKPVLLVAAGPSLQEEFENLRYIKEQGLAYIFSVGSANRALLKQGIIPDAVTSYDPNTYNHQVFQEIIDQKIDNIPLIFGSSVGHHTLDVYPGPMLHMITSQDTISRYYLDMEKNSNDEIISDAPSIAVLTLELLSKLNCSKIILVGQNLSFRNNQYYAAGIEYRMRTNQLTDKDLESAVKVESVDGEQIPAKSGHVMAKGQMESIIQKISKNIQVINTTKGGAKIRGTEFIPLERVISEYLTKKVVVENWYDATEESYNAEMIEKQTDKIQRAFLKFYDDSNDLIKVLRKMNDYANTNNTQQILRNLPKFDKLVKRVLNNDYFLVYLRPMIRVQYDIFMKSVPAVQATVDPVKKAKLIIAVFGKLLGHCQQCDEQIGKKIYQKIQEDLSNYSRSLIG